MQIAIMDYNSVSIFIATIPEEDVSNLLNSEDLDIFLVLDYINEKYDKTFKPSECYWMYIDKGKINIEQV
jgi:hypothetical protein